MTYIMSHNQIWKTLLGKIFLEVNLYFNFTRIGTYIQRGSKICFVVVVVVEVIDIAQNTALLSNFHHAFSILHHCMQLCPAALPDSLARQPLPTALPVSLARQDCQAALPGSLACQSCPAALPGSLARQPCPAALPGSLAR
jgi:hypothetical protein